MEKMFTVLILNSYQLNQRDAFSLFRIKAFLQGLKSRGIVEGKNLRVEMIDSNSLKKLRQETEQRLNRQDIPVNLIHAVGSPNAEIAGMLTDKVPIVYYGAHPEGTFLDTCRKKNIYGMALTLPFTSNYKRYRFLKKLLPKVKTVYVPFYSGTGFCRPEAIQRHDEYRKVTSGGYWIEGESNFIGFRTLAGLNYIIGTNYREYVYSDSLELEFALSQINSDDSVLMVYNDTVYCHGAIEQVRRFAGKNKVPFIWNNNPEATQIGAVAAFAGCFQESGFQNGVIGAKLLLKRQITEPQIVTSKKSYSSINISKASHFGVNLFPEILDLFDEKIG